LKKLKMKKIWLLTFLGVLLTGCQQKVNPEALQIYNDRLMSIQEQSVNSLEQYYRSLETWYNGTNLNDYYATTLSQFESLKKEAQKVFVPHNENELKVAVITYISWLQATFEKNEKPVVELLTSFSGNATDFYRKNKQIFSSYAMKLANDLAILDKNLSQSHQSFQKKHQKIFTPTKK